MCVPEYFCHPVQLMQNIPTKLSVACHKTEECSQIHRGEKELPSRCDSGDASCLLRRIECHFERWESGLGLGSLHKVGGKVHPTRKTNATAWSNEYWQYNSGMALNPSIITVYDLSWDHRSENDCIREPYKQDALYTKST